MATLQPAEVDGIRHPVHSRNHLSVLTSFRETFHIFTFIDFVDEIFAIFPIFALCLEHPDVR